MKKWTGGLVILGLSMVLVVSYSWIGKSQSSMKHHSPLYDFFNPHPVEEDQTSATDADARSDKSFRFKAHYKDYEGLDELYSLISNITKQDSSILLTSSHMRFLFPRTDALPEMAQGIKEGLLMWRDLLLKIEEINGLNYSLQSRSSAKACPHFVSAYNTSSLVNVTSLEIPCGLVEDSSVTLIGIPDAREASFVIDFIGSQLKGQIKPPVVLQYKVLLPGENLTKEPVSIQNTWTIESGWGKEEKCPDHGSPDLLQVDGLVKCNTQTIRRVEGYNKSGSHSGNLESNAINSSNVSGGISHASHSFHFLEGNPFTATIWSGNEGFHMTVNGRHETSFAYRERLEPWLVNGVRWRGGLTVLSVLAKGLPVNDDVELVKDAQKLKAGSISNKKLLLLIGVFSSGNNFARRMALRRTWMQFDAVRSGSVAVRFFIGLHKNKDVNFNLWREGQAFGDVQLMPFVDYYGLLTYKTIAICIMGTDILSAKYIMKMDDDAFVRIDEILASLKKRRTNGLLYGRISFKSSPQRDEDNKWFISEKEWPHSSYPPWAHGPGYVMSEDIARFIVQEHNKRKLTLFKLEDVAVGIWVEQLRRRGHKIEYVTDDRFCNSGCETDYILAHYQNPRKILCLWEKLQKQHAPECCE